MNEPAFAILHVEKLRLTDLHAVTAHNSRTMRVPNADPTIADGVKRFRCLGDNPIDAFFKRLDASGAKLPSFSRYVAMEVVLSLSPNHDRPPSRRLFLSRCEDFIDDAFGSTNVFTAWLHTDERSEHVHALVALVCNGHRPGFSKVKKAERKPVPVVSWNIFSGSDTIHFEKQKDGSRKRHNPVMAGWQTKWALRWADHGYRRGIPSKRDHILMRHIHGKTAAVAAMADIAKEGVHAAISGYSVPVEALAKLTGEQVATMVQADLKAKLLPLIEHQVAPLVEVANRGHQLEAERKSRVDLADKNETLRQQVAELEARPDPRPLAVENEQLKTEVARLDQSLSDANEFNGADYVRGLSDADLMKLFEEERQRREVAHQTSARDHSPRPLSKPVVAPGVSLSGLAR